MKWILRSPARIERDLLGTILSLRNQTLDDLPLLASVEQLTSFTKLANVEKAATQIAQAIKDGKKIYVHGDYDVDGVCATSILWKFLYREANADALPFIPSRFETGYGLTPQSLDQLQSEGGQLIITVDCGIRDVDLIKEYQTKGLEFIVTDHHQFAVDEKGKITLPKCTVVHPRLPKQEYPTAEVCAAFVAWKLVQAVAAELGIGYDPLTDIDLVALATSCDMMPLTLENRIVVKLGIERIRHNPNLGIAKLLEIAGIKQNEVQAYHLGFVLGPRLNAAGRLESATTALKLLCTQNSTQAAELARQLDDLNRKRQDLTLQYLEIAETELSTRMHEKIMLIHGKDWPEGILGLVAGKLSEKFNRPVLVGSQVGDKIVGSARSIEKLHITNVLNDLQKHLVRYGGHAQAAGFTVLADAIDQFQQDLIARGDLDLVESDLEPILYADLNLNAKAANVAEVLSLQQLEPHGMGNPKPNALIANINLNSQRIFGKNSEHISFEVAEQPELELIWFGKANYFNELNLDKNVDVIVQLGISNWRNIQKVQGIIKDIRRAILD